MEEMAAERRMLVLLIGGSLITCHLFGVLYKRPSFASNFRKFLSRCYTACFARREESGSQFEKRVALELQAWKMQGAKAALRTSSWFLAVWCVSMLFSTALDRLRWMTYLQEATFFCIYGTMLVLTHCPRLLSGSNAQYWYAYFMLLTYSMVLPLAANTHIQFIMQRIMFPQFMFGLLCLGAKFLLPFNILMTLVVIFVNTRDMGVTSNPDVDRLAILVNTVFVHLALHGVAVWMKAEACYKIELELRSNEHSAARSLLEKLCDVLVELDSDLCIVDGPAKLAAVLIRSASPSLTGEHFQSLLVTEDSNRFQSEIPSTLLEEENACHIMHVRMKDSCGNQVHMELFAVKLSTLDKSPHYLVGVREFTDVLPMTTAGSAEEAAPERAYEDAPTASVLGPTAIFFNDSDELREASLHLRKRMRRRSRRSGTGTPAENASEGFRDDAASQVPDVLPVATCGLGLSSLEACSLIHTSYMPTTIQGKIVLMLKTLAACNVPYRKLRCCRFHCLVEDARATLNGLNQLPCQETAPQGEWQCHNCGVIDRDACMQDGTFTVCFEPGIAPQEHTSL
eukprot:TRINITY_DN12096_c0_g1_i3.p1 TRINITY_DN12096_c0_g1~~TRINITY_DN12096_c0_g1_i3.p1  ORF type:complete len:568 (-),score=73.63 TRINITY_DN12096_c0_g1_i3:23-1726(-)